MAEDWLKMPALDLGGLIGAGRVDPLDLTEVYLEAIANHPYASSIYARVTPVRARAEAKAASNRARSGMRLSRLDGVPISWKDLFDTAGIATHAGSKILGDRVPGKDAAVLRNAVAAGLVCIGKTHMSELAFSGLGKNPVTGTPRCVNDLNAAPGGSSSGAAASVAFDLAAAGIGSDTAGSVRIPAAWNDLVGLKTTAGLLSLEGVVPLCAKFDTVGPLTRTVDDAGCLLGVLAGKAGPDLAESTLKNARLLNLTSTAMVDLEDEPRSGFESAVDKLARAGADISTFEFPEIDDALELAACLYTVEAYATWQSEIDAAPELMFDKIRERFVAGGQYSGIEYVAAWRRLERIRDGYWKAVAGCDAVIVPTTPILPPEIARLESEQGFYESENLRALRNTRIANLMGAPSLTIPTAVPSTGVMLIGFPFEDERMLRIGKAAEQALHS